MSEPLDLGPIRARVEAATEGPWEVAPEKCGPNGQGVYQVESGGCVCEVGDPYPRGGNRERPVRTAEACASLSHHRRVMEDFRQWADARHAGGDTQ